MFPSACRVCGQRLRHARRLPVCPDCLEAVPPLSRPGCRQCGKAYTGGDGDTDGRCLRCVSDAPAYDGAICATAYAGAGRELIHLLKFGGVRPAAVFWADRLAALAAQLPEAPDVVVPVALGRRRQWERGFNQSGEIGRHLAHRLGCGYAGRGLRRRRETQAQAGLSAEQREHNLQGAFTADGRRVAGRCVLLVDDVLTTGATARAAARALVRGGARRVMLAAAARTDRHPTAAGTEAAA